MSVTVLLLSIAGAIVATSAWTMEARPDHALRLVLVESPLAMPARDALHHTIVSALASAASKRAGSPVEINVSTTNATEARARLGAGRCDAVLILGEERPAVFRRIDALTLSGELGAEAGARPACLIIGKDAPMRELLATAFANVLVDRAARQTISAAGHAAGDRKILALAP